MLISLCRRMHQLIVQHLCFSMHCRVWQCCVVLNLTWPCPTPSHSLTICDPTRQPLNLTSVIRNAVLLLFVIIIHISVCVSIGVCCGACGRHYDAHRSVVGVVRSAIHRQFTSGFDRCNQNTSNASGCCCCPMFRRIDNSCKKKINL